MKRVLMGGRERKQATGESVQRGENVVMEGRTAGLWERFLLASHTF